jgi:hypothetical protein
VTVTQAAAIWIAEKKRRQDVAGQFEEAERILKDHFRSSGKAEYAGKAGRIGYARTVRRVLDTAAVKKFLGKRLGDYQRDSEVESLSLLSGSADG